MRHFLLLLLQILIGMHIYAQKTINFLNLKGNTPNAKSCNLDGGSLYVRVNHLWTFIPKTEENKFSVTPQMDNTITHDTASSVEFIVSTNYADYEVSVVREAYSKFNPVGFSIIKTNKDYSLLVTFPDASAMGESYPVKLRETKKHSERFLE